MVHQIKRMTVLVGRLDEIAVYDECDSMEQEWNMKQQTAERFPVLKSFAKVSVRKSLNRAARMVVVVEHAMDLSRGRVVNTCIDFDDRSVKDHVIRKILYRKGGAIN